MFAKTTMHVQQSFFAVSFHVKWPADFISSLLIPFNYSDQEVEIKFGVEMWEDIVFFGQIHGSLIHAFKL